jgi:hypothetical protein
MDDQEECKGPITSSSSPWPMMFIVTNVFFLFFFYYEQQVIFKNDDFNQYREQITRITSLETKILGS